MTGESVEKMSPQRELLVIKGLKTSFHTKMGAATAVDDLDLSVKEGQVVGLVGESGCGKSVTALSILRLIKDPPGKIEAGRILFEGEDLLKKPIAEMRRIRGNRISMIFQEPMTSLNPVHRVGDQIAEAISLHQDLPKREAFAHSVEMLKAVGIQAPARRAKAYPHQLSGGMRQRVMIAMALCCSPKLLIADEPTTALDVTIQAQILDLMLKLQEETRTSIILITHDLGVIAETAQYVAVMYAGKIVEYSEVYELFTHPVHPYTVGLMRSIPRPGRDRTRQRKLEAIPGVVPSLTSLPQGCRFSDRCSRAWEKCFKEDPPDVEVAPEHHCRCWLHVH